jgi:hypothetical protein
LVETLRYSTTLAPIVLYYNPETEQPLKLILLSYQGLLQASKQVPILLDTLAEAPLTSREP